MAIAEPMDPALERLVIEPECQRGKGQIGVWDDTPNPSWAPGTLPGGSAACQPDHAAFKRLINQFGFALAPTAMHSARTTGYGGFHLSMEADYTSVSTDAAYWKDGTQGAVDPSNGQSSTVNDSVQSLLQLYSLKFRKSFGFGLEITGLVGFMPKTSIISGGADVRLSLLEGFRTGVGGILPDVAVGGGVRTITGTPQFQLTVAGLDAQISKPLPIQDSQVLTPYVGYQYLWIWGDSGLIDLTPGTDALRYCNYAGQNVPGNTDPDAIAGGKLADDGQPVCSGGSPLDFNNNVVFKAARLERHRMIFGLNYRYEMVMLGGQFLIDAIPPADAQNDAADEAALKDEDRQFTLSFELGAM
ncbi:MAG TPA: hypothetical protein VJN18_08470, partial [Polyangiaceae bacterium]|nr:hypothetical protein [Polyangiaceae bacterium]